MPTSNITSIKKDTITIVNNGAKCFGINKSDNNNIYSIYRKFIINIAEPNKNNTAKKVLNSLRALIFIFPLITILVDKFLAEYKVYGINYYLVWVFVIVFWLLFFFIDLYFPKDSDALFKEANYFKALGLAERFAAQVALYSKTKLFIYDRDEGVISKISKSTSKIFSNDLIDIINERKDIIKGIKHCDDIERTRIFIDKTIFDPKINEKIQDVVNHINDAACSIFFGSNFTTKLYFATENTVKINSEKGKEEELNIRLLTSIYKQNKYNYNEQKSASSWIEIAEGKQSEVWKCLKDGKKFNIKTNVTGYKGVTYPSVLYIILPGKIGALTIAADNEFAFDNMVSEDATDTLGFAARDLLLKAIEINN